ncbi:hypothetical protein CEXT_175381 [Caerostris extrusa]|uniref:Uncharacterized protein n=1 Tax=Caerostris extrusa TaxID=172846 RepID=A0AAV4PV26_CAEEX|nr:hypothetical protein CEXT_175381 [Caerostris extrusa]
MGQLPAARVTPTRVFNRVGVDFVVHLKSKISLDEVNRRMGASTVELFRQKVMKYFYGVHYGGGGQGQDVVVEPE